MLGKGPTELHPSDAQWRENFFLHGLLVAAAGCGLDDAPEQQVAEVRVGEAGAGVEVERPTHGETHDILGFCGRLRSQGRGNLARHADRIPGLVPIPAARVLKAVPHGDQIPPRIDLGASRKVRLQPDVIQHRLVELHLVGIDELQHRRGCDRLRDAGDAEERVRLHGKFLVHVRQPEATSVDERTIARNGERPAGHFVLGKEARHELVEWREPRAIVRARDRGGSDRGLQQELTTS